jgi:glycogen(starch) synthase
MRILMAAQFYPPTVGGEERHVQSLARQLVRRGHEVAVLTLAARTEGAGTVDDQGVTVVWVRSSLQRIPRVHHDAERPHASPLSDGAVARATMAILHRVRPDVVHAHNWIVNSMIDPCRRAGVPLVLTLHDYSHVCAVKRLMRHGIECPGPTLRRCAACASSHYGAAAGVPVALSTRHGTRRRQAGVSRFIAVSTPVAEGNRLADGPVRYDVIPNFIPDDLLRPVQDAAPRRPELGAPIVYIGDLSADKGVPVLLEAYRGLADPPPLVLAGRRTALMLDLPFGAVVRAELPHADVMALMRSSRFVVVPSVWPDPCPTVVLEAMAAACPVIAASSGGIVDMVEDGVTGLLVAPGDPAALRQAMTRILGMAEGGRALGDAGRVAVERFTARHVVPRIEAIYGELTGDRPVAR